MTPEVQCDGCGHTLRIASDVRLPLLTCPRCLALVKNTAFAEDGGAELRRSPEPLRSSAQCYRCGRSIEPTFRFCPYCTASLTPRERKVVPPPDEDVHRDLSWLGSGLVTMGLLGAVGVMLFILNGGLAEIGNWSIEGIVVIWALLLVLPAVGIGLGATSKKPGRGIMVGLTGGMTIALISMGLPIVLVLALFVALLNTCAKCGQSARPVNPGNPAPALPVEKNK